MRGSYKPYIGDDYKSLYERTQADSKSDDPPDTLRSLAADYVRGYTDPSELLLEAHSNGTSIRGIDRAIQQAAALEGADEAWQGYSIGSEEGDTSTAEPEQAADSNSQTAATTTPVDNKPSEVKKLEKLDEASEATAELTQGKKELAEGKAELAEDAGDEAAAEKAKGGIKAAAAKGMAAIKGKAGAAKKIAIGAALGQGLTNLEQATGGKASYNLSALDTADGQGVAQPETKTDTAEDMKKRLDETAAKKQAEKGETVNLGTWGGGR